MKYRLKSEDVNKDIIKLICENRQVDYNNLAEYLNPTKEHVTTPALYMDIDRACSEILEVVKRQGKIGILVDSDADGYCSSAMMVNYLHDVLNHTNFMFFIHENKEHGLTPYIMKKLKENPVDLLIVPDAGSNDFDQHFELDRIAGTTVVVIDHHEAERRSNYATVVNNQLDLFGNKTLSGAGMVLKALERFDEILGVERSAYYYDLVSVALVADSMLINNAETRYYVQQGLKDLNNPLLLELYKGEEVRNIESISYDVAPTINAFTRVATLEEREDLFKSMIGYKDIRTITIRNMGSFELELPEYIARLASRIKSRQTTLINKALNSETTMLFQEDYPIVFCVVDETTNKSLTGLIGNRLVEKYNKPAIVLKDMGNELLSGSGRATDTFEDFREYINSTKRFNFAQGHAGAFGCSISKENLLLFCAELKGTSIGEDSECFVVDKAYHNTVSAFEVMAVDELKPYWSRGFEVPKFFIKIDDMSRCAISIIGKKKDTIKIVHNKITYIKFKCSKEEIEAVENKKVTTIEMIGSFSVNEYYDNLYPQVIIDRLEVQGEVIEKFTGFSEAIGFGNFVW